jgi:hypothetical protein
MGFIVVTPRSFRAPLGYNIDLRFNAFLSNIAQRDAPLMVLISHVSLTDSIMGACVSYGQKTSPPEVIKGKSPERSGLQLDVEAALPIGKASAVKVRLSSLPKTAEELTP